MTGWFKIHVTRNYTEAEIIKGMLEENGINVLIMNKLDSSYINFGNIELHVPLEQKEMAQQLLKEDSFGETKNDE